MADGRAAKPPRTADCRAAKPPEAIRIHALPAFADNYIYLVEDGERAAVIDPGEAGPVRAFLRDRGLMLDAIYLTHHHDDHIGGAEVLRRETGCRLVGYAEDAPRLPSLDMALADGEWTYLLDQPLQLWHVPGHTQGHVAYYLQKSDAIFCGDTLFSGGCGRLFEGTPEQMMVSLALLTQWSDETRLCAAHEYTENNLRFALSLLPDDPAVSLRLVQVQGLRESGRATVPTTIGEEKRSNLFLRVGEPAVKAALGLAESASELACFTELRARRNRW